MNYIGTRGLFVLSRIRRRLVNSQCAISILKSAIKAVKANPLKARVKPACIVVTCHGIESGNLQEQIRWTFVFIVTWLYYWCLLRVIANNIETIGLDNEFISSCKTSPELETFKYGNKNASLQEGDIPPWSSQTAMAPGRSVRGQSLLPISKKVICSTRSNSMRMWARGMV